MTTRRKVFTGLALAAVAAVAGCLDALAPAAPHRVGSLGIVPVFEGAAARDGIPADVDSIVVTIRNPPAPPITVGQHIEPGQDSIVLTIDVPMGAAVDTVTMDFVALRTNSNGSVDTLYTGTQDIPVRVGQPSHADSVAVRYVGPGQNIQSLTLTPHAVVLQPGATFSTWAVAALDSTDATIIGMPVLWHSADAATVTIDATGLARGMAIGQTYVFAIAGARSSVYDSALVVVSTSPVAVIGLAPGSATFSATASGADPAAQTVAVTNTGVGPLAGLAVGTVTYGASEPTGWLVASLSGASAPATLTLQPATGTLTAGTYHATVPVTSAQASNSPQTVAVTFTVAAGPAIGLSPTTVTFTDTLTTSDPAAKTVAVTNAGTGTLGGLAVGTINYVTGSGWLTASLNQATAPATLTLSVAKGALTAGTYTATVPITSAAASNSPQSVAVTFTIAPLPLIGLSATAVTFSDTLTTTDPAAQTVTVTNAGTGTLNGLALGTINYVTGSGWLTASLNQATAPATLTLTVAKGSLTPGTYTATVPVTSAVAGNTPQSVSVTFTIAPASLVRIVLTPGFGVLPPAGTLPLSVQGFDAASGPVPAVGLRYLSRTPGVASVDSLTGVATAVAGGSAVIVASATGATGTVYDSTLVAVTPNGTAVALPVSNGHAFGAANVGDTVHVLVAVNIGALPGEKLGSYNAQLDWNASLLQYVSTAPVSFAVSTTLNESATSTGQLRFGAADPNGVAGPSFALVDVKFVATASGSSAVTFALTDLSGISPTFTQMLTQALVLSGSVQVK